jgi:DNA-binding HxlR family transcriptional regulator
VKVFVVLKERYFIFESNIALNYKVIMKKYPVRCPITTYLSIMDGHWKPIIVWYLREKPLRFKDMMSIIPDISTKVLTEQLKELEADHIIHRKAFDELPPRVEYNLTSYGTTLLPGLSILREWGFNHLKENKNILHPDSQWHKKLALADYN